MSCSLLRNRFAFARSFLAALTATVAMSLPAALRAQTPSLTNLSTRALVGTGGNILITGFTIGPGSGKTMLIRATGPALTGFGVAGALADPTLTLLDSNGVVVATNDNWLASDAATMTSVGAFALVPGSKDAALVAANLPPGGYTVQVSGVGGTTGVALIELYDISGGATRLVNLSTRALVGTGGNALIPGIVISPGIGTRRLLIRAAGPALAAFGVAGTLADPTISMVNSAGVVVATNDNWGTPSGTAAATAVQVGDGFTKAGAFAFATGSKDAAILGDFAPDSYTALVTGADGGTGVALVEIYDLTPSAVPVVTITAARASADTSGSNPGQFIFTRSGDTLAPLNVGYVVSGTALNGFDYPALPGYVTIPAGSASVTVSLQPNPTVSAALNNTVILTVNDGGGYSAGAQKVATITITNLPPVLYAASLRPYAGASDSTASGTATILLSADGSVASVNVSFSNLTSQEVVAHLKVGGSGQDGPYVFNLPYGQANGAQWTFTPTGQFSAADLIAALKAGNIYVGIDSAQYPNGEVRGNFIQSTGSQTFTAPAAPPALDLSRVTASDASRFLTQATFGPTDADLATLTAKGYNQWIADQIALAPSKHLAATQADFNALSLLDSSINVGQSNRQAAWWKIAVGAPDQLRQRVAFALSEILVVSDANAALNRQPYGLANYYDILVSDSFGNFRQLLNDVTLSPVMGQYLSMLQSQKGDSTKGTSADENYAREIMQLFTIGLNRLQPDGTFQLDSSGLPIPTYTQTTITEIAKVFTGWGYGNAGSILGGPTDYITPMKLFPTAHDDAKKTILDGAIIPAAQGGAADLKQMLDALFNHPNTGPFISRELIQRLVTSNPSPAYVYRVAQVFANDGTGTRGNLAAVVKAILIDFEARAPQVNDNLGFGKLREPLLRTTALLRALNGAPTTAAGSRFGGGMYGTPEQGTASLNQASLRAPTVFNFFEPNYVLPGAIASAGLYAPEFQITNGATAINVPNYLYSVINNGGGVSLDLSSLTALAANPSGLLDRLGTLFLSGSMSTQLRTRVTAALAGVPNGTSDTEKVRTALYLVVTSPEGAVQK